MMKKGYNCNMFDQAISEHYTKRRTFTIKDYSECNSSGDVRSGEIPAIFRGRDNCICKIEERERASRMTPRIWLE